MQYNQGGDTPSILNAGIPNINGALWQIYGYDGIEGMAPRGAFYSERVQNANAQQTDNSTGWTQGWIYLDASRSSDVYGNSRTVQPPAIGLIPQLRY